jgi:glycosyltransferase involved in cell wall biosynthesis
MSRSGGSLKVLHVLRAPLGGLFRHVVDLAHGQVARGHQVGIIIDELTGNERADATLATLTPSLALGLTRVPMSRHLGWGDVSAWRHVTRRLANTNLDIVHGHGAKGGAYARLTDGRAVRVYTPHGGSLHLTGRSPAGMVYLQLERLLEPRTELFVFESAYAERLFRARVADPSGAARTIHNGVSNMEFAPAELRPRPAELVFIGELRRLKGVDVLIEALGRLAQSGRSVRASIVGEGPDAEAFGALARKHGVVDLVEFMGPLPSRQALGQGRIVIVPSLAESLPYIVLEAAAAGIAVIATAVGGIPEILGPQAFRLIPPGDAIALAEAIASELADPDASRAYALTLRERVRKHFSVDSMVDEIVDAYRETLLGSKVANCRRTKAFLKLSR